MTTGPGLRKWTEYLSPGPGGMPLALRLSDWLGLTRGTSWSLAGRPQLSVPLCVNHAELLDSPSSELESSGIPLCSADFLCVGVIDAEQSGT